MKQFLFLALFFIATISFASPGTIEPGASQMNLYLPLLKNKRVAVFVNHASLIDRKHLIDVLLEHDIHITKIFAPEHGFRTDIDGDVNDTMDDKTGIPIISLYGKKSKPSHDDLSNVDILLFDIQDVGVRFYTYISSLQKLMEAAVEQNKPLIVLDRPNPNGFYIDGPVLDPKFKSFTGMQAIPFVYGMTIGEYATMLVGEEWLDVKPKSKAHDLKLTIIPVANYTHKSLYELPVKPSPSLPDIQSIYWYASTGLLEATAISVGRGTNKPFQYIGHPDFKEEFSFIPIGNAIVKHPPHENKICYGWDLSGTKQAVLKAVDGKLQIKYLLTAYRMFPNKDKFFGKYFDNAVGNDSLRKQIIAGASESEIRKSWQPQLVKFKKIRQKYLLYPDF